MLRRSSLHLSAMLALSLLAGLAQADELRTITVAGRASVDAVPDIARVSLAVQRRNPDMAAAREATTKVTASFLALCRRLGIKDAKIRTSGLNIQPEYRWDPQDNQQIFTGYFVQRQLEVELDNLDRLGELLEGAVDLGVNQVSPPQFDSTRRAALAQDALAAAATDARSNAARIAASLGVKLGPLRTLNAVGESRPPMPEFRTAAMAMDAGPAAKTYEAGEIAFPANVVATFDVLVD